MLFLQQQQQAPHVQGEMIVVREMTLAETEAYIGQPFVNSPAGFLMAVHWFIANKKSLYYS